MAHKLDFAIAFNLLSVTPEKIYLMKSAESQFHLVRVQCGLENSKGWRRGWVIVDDSTKTANLLSITDQQVYQISVCRKGNGLYFTDTQLPNLRKLSNIWIQSQIEIRTQMMNQLLVEVTILNNTKILRRNGSGPGK